jgi:hypothetical protein
MSIKHGIKIQQHNFPPEWVTLDPWPGPPFYLGKGGGGGYLLSPSVLVGFPSPWTVSPLLAKPPSLPYNWHPATFVDECQPKIQTMMESFLTKFRGRCLVSNILTESGKQFISLPQLEAYPNGIFWLHSISLYPYGSQCTFAGGHVPKGTLTDTQANEVVAALQAGVTAMVTRVGPPSPIGKCKYRGGSNGAGDPRPLHRCDWVTQSLGGGGEENWAWHSGVWGVDEIRNRGGQVCWVATAKSIMDKLLANPHSALWRASRWQKLGLNLEKMCYELGEKRCSLEGTANPSLTAQVTLLDGAEGKLVDSTAKDNRMETPSDKPEITISDSPSGLADGNVVDLPLASARVLGGGIWLPALVSKGVVAHVSNLVAISETTAFTPHHLLRRPAPHVSV